MIERSSISRRTNSHGVLSNYKTKQSIMYINSSNRQEIIQTYTTITRQKSEFIDSEIKYIDKPSHANDSLLLPF